MASPARAQTAGDETYPDEIVVIAQRYPGSVVVPQLPIAVFDEQDVASYGAGSLEELLEAMAPQVSSARGRGEGHPVILVNGQRVSNFRELRNYPPEAVRRVEVLPEEVALRYGYPADQRVVNFILKPNFRSKTVAGKYKVPTRGGFADSELEASVLAISGPSRINLKVKLEDTSLLTEAARRVIQTPGNIPTVAGDPDPARYRSLVADSRDMKAEGSWATGLGEGGLDGALTLSGSFSRSDSLSLAGLNMVTLTAPGGDSDLRSLPGALERATRTDTFEGGITLNKPLGHWQFTATLDGNHSTTTTWIDRRADTSGLIADAASGVLAIDGPLPALPDAGRDRAKVTTNVVSADAVLSGSPFSLPAGDVSTSFSTGHSFTGIDSRDTRIGGSNSLRRNDFYGSASVSLPLTSRREGVLDALGDVSLSIGGGLNELSDFGTLTNWNAGLTWSPLENLSLQASYIAVQAAPGLTDLGNPEVQTLNVPVYDFTRGETALVTVTTGGNPALTKEKRRDIKLSATWDLPFLEHSNLLVEYFRNRSDDVTSSFPVLTPAIEAAFPDRVTRDASGTLVAVDRRPVTFASTASSRLRYGVNLSGSYGKQPEGHGGRHGGGASMMGPPGGDRGRWRLGIFHTVRFSETATIAAGGPVLDLLNGDALTDGGVARHAIELEGGTFYRGFGLRLNGTYTAPVHVDGSGAPGSSDLRFGSTFVLDLRLFVDFGRQEKLVAQSSFFKGLRLAFTIDNLFDSRQRVTDQNGDVPLGYQADYRDPRGRVIGIDLRKMF